MHDVRLGDTDETYSRDAHRRAHVDRCYGVPAFRFGGREWDYFTYTWHTNRDTFDKLVFEEVKHSATLIAAMTYLAAEDPERVSRDRRDAFPTDPLTGDVMTWPTCREPERSYPGRAN